MGLLRSKNNMSTEVIDGVHLGVPVITHSDGTPFGLGDSITDLWFGWDDPGLPSGELKEDGTVVPDEPPAVD